MPISQLYSGNPNVYLDGIGADFDVPVQHGPTRYSRPQFPYTLAGNCLLAEQTFRQKLSLWNSASPGTNLGFFSPAPGSVGPFYLTTETPHRDIGGGLVEWERQSASLPTGFDLPAILAKTFYYVSYIWSAPTGASISDAVVNSFTRSLKGRIHHDFYLNTASVPAIPKTPYVQVVRFGGYGGITDMGTGFPLDHDPGGHTPNLIWINNERECCLGGSIDNYYGNMVVLKTNFAGV
jgi:hypothetical protein